MNNQIPEGRTATQAITGESLEVPKAWRSLFAPYGRSDARRSLFQLISTAGLFVLVWWAMLRSLELSYAITLLLSLVGGGLVVRLFIILHDCAHGSFFRSHTANQYVGRILGVLTLTPYLLWRRHHLVHHATSGNLDRRGFGDIDTLTVREYLDRSWFSRLCYRLTRNPLVFLTLGPSYTFLLKHRLPLGMPRAWKKEWMSVLWNNIALAAVVTLMASIFGLGTFLSIQIPLFLVSSTAGIWLFYVQHQFADAYWQKDEDWDFAAACLQGSSYLDLPRVLRWFTGNIGIHHIHHLCSAIPNYRLQECLDEVQGLPPPHRLTFWTSLRCARLSLWDEDSEKLVGFRDIRPSIA